LQSKFSATPLFNTSDPAPEFNFEVALRTSLSLQVGFPATPNVDLLEIDLDMPGYNITAHQLSNIDYQCNGITGKTPANQKYNNLTHITEELVLDASWRRGEILGGQNSTESIFGPVDLHNVTSSCLAFSPILQSQVNAPKLVSDLNSNQILNAAGKPAKHLNNGGAVGITFAVEIFLIAVVAGTFWLLAFRRAQHDGSPEHHSVKKGTIAVFLAGVGMAIVGLFKRKSRQQEDHSERYPVPTRQPEPPITEKDWSYKGPVDTTAPTSNPGETPQFVPLTQHEVATTGYYQSSQPQQYSRTSPASASHQGFDNVPWEEPRSNNALSSPKGIFRKGVPGQ
jgi:hypothetical protein